ncbi:hypothetical protein [Mycobacterium kubicae]|nr:hypothetical protein [Mycobacterium kubicae]
MRVISFANLASLWNARNTGYLPAAQIRQPEVQVGWVYDIKADSNSCKRA